jgi:predicted ATPase
VAVAVATRVRASYKDGAWFVGLAPLSDPDLVPSAVGTALGVAPSGGDHTRALAAWFRERNALLVLDNCEHVIGAVAALAEALLRAAPHAGILATAREPLRVEGEWLHRLTPLELPPQEKTSPTAAEALGYSAVELFNERATAKTDSFVLDDTDVPAVLEICRRLDGVPLALELAAARVDTLGVDGLAARLDDRFGVLTSGRRTALPRQQTLRAAMDWSYELLPETEQAVLRRLAVFRGAFTTAAAVAIVIDERIVAKDAIEGIANLVGKSLITTDIADNNPHHRLLDTTRAYAIEKLGKSGERGAVAYRHAEYYRDLFERAEGEAAARPTDEWLADYARQIDNLRAALDWAFSPRGDAAIGVALTAAAVPLWMGLSLLEECRGRVEQALYALGPAANRNPRREMQLHAALGASLLLTIGSTPKIEEACTTAFRLAESLGDTEYQLKALWGLWVYRNHRGEYSVALAVAQRFYTLAREHADPNDRLTGERMIGISHQYRGDLTEARSHLERTLRDSGDPQRRSPFIRLRYDQKVAGQVMLARTVWLQGFADQAWRTVRRAIGDAEALGHPATLCYALCHGGCLVALWVGNLTEAERYTETLLDHSSKHGLAQWGAFATRLKGVVIIKGGDVDTGLPLLRACLDEITDPNPSFPFLTGFCETVEGFFRGGRIADGLRMVEAGIERDQGGWLTPELLRLKGEILLLQSTPAVAETAADLFWQALDWARGQGALSWELRAATSLARLLRDQGRSADATGVLQPVYDRFAEGFETADLNAAKALLDALH